MSRTLLLLSTLLSFIVIACTASNEQQDASAQTTTEAVVLERLSAEAFKEKLDTFGEQVHLVDVRTPGEYANGTIAGAININVNDQSFETKVAQLDRETPIMVFCQAGSRSRKASKKLKALGFKEIYDLSVGYSGWPEK